MVSKQGKRFHSFGKFRFIKYNPFLLVRQPIALRSIKFNVIYKFHVHILFKTTIFHDFPPAVFFYRSQISVETGAHIDVPAGAISNSTMFFHFSCTIPSPSGNILPHRKGYFRKLFSTLRNLRNIIFTNRSRFRNLRNFFRKGALALFSAWLRTEDILASTEKAVMHILNFSNLLRRKHK